MPCSLTKAMRLQSNATFLVPRKRPPTLVSTFSPKSIAVPISSPLSLMDESNSNTLIKPINTKQPPTHIFEMTKITHHDPLLPPSGQMQLIQFHQTWEITRKILFS